MHVRQSVLGSYLIQQSSVDFKRPVPGLDIGYNSYKYVDGAISYTALDLGKNQREILKNPIKNTEQCYKEIYKICKTYVDLCKRHSKKDFSKTTNEELISDFQYFMHNHKAKLAIIGVPVFLEPLLTKFVWDIVSSKSGNAARIFMNVAIASKQTEHLTAKMNLLKIAISISKDKRLSELFKKDIGIIESQLKTYPTIYEKVTNHLNDFGWVQFCIFIGEKRTIKDIILEIREALNKNPKKEYQELRQNLKKTEEVFNQAIRKLKLSQEELQHIRLLRQLIFLRTYRLDAINKSGYVMYPLFDEIGRRLNMNSQDVVWLTPDEIITLLRKEKLDYKIDIANRKKHYAMIMLDWKVRLYFGEEFHQLLKRETGRNIEGDKVEGLAVFPGKLRGRATIVLNKTQIKKVRQGDIMVTTMTTPDFIMAIEKAAAIVTDLGGVTSHAAIISREFRKPCIVGTKIATKVFKDGDILEVDAHKGIVRRIR